jgi:hypothetical protein
VFMNAEVLRLLWPGNSPDLNMIEPCWPWMKRKTTRLETPRSRAAATKAWTKCWTKQLDQDRIQRWIERIPRHIQQIIELDEDNEYRENREDEVIRPYDSKDRRIRYLGGKRGFVDSDSDDSITVPDTGPYPEVNIFYPAPYQISPFTWFYHPIIMLLISQNFASSRHIPYSIPDFIHRDLVSFIQQHFFELRYDSELSSFNSFFEHVSCDLERIKIRRLRKMI